MIQAVIGATLIAAPAFAEDQKGDKPAAAEKPAAPKPPEEVATAAKHMGGTWKCAGTSFASPMGPEHKYESTLTWKLSADKYYIVGTYAEKKSKEHPAPYKFTEYRTYDPKASKWIAAHMGEMGDMMTGSGTQDDKSQDWTWKAVSTPMMPGDFHLTTAVKSPKEIEIKGEVVAADGAKPSFAATCKK